MTDKEFLHWVYQRLVYVHHEREIGDYMIRLKNLIAKQDDTHEQDSRFQIKPQTKV